jgi:hypothetical protein
LGQGRESLLSWETRPLLFLFAVMLIPFFLLAPHWIPLNSVTSEEKARQEYVCTMCCVCICIFSVCACVFCAVCTYVLCILSACVHVCACVFCHMCCMSMFYMCMLCMLVCTCVFCVHGCVMGLCWCGIITRVWWFVGECAHVWMCSFGAWMHPFPLGES